MAFVYSTGGAARRFSVSCLVLLVLLTGGPGVGRAQPDNVGIDNSDGSDECNTMRDQCVSSCWADGQQAYWVECSKSSNTSAGMVSECSCFPPMEMVEGELDGSALLSLKHYDRAACGNMTWVTDCAITMRLDVVGKTVKAIPFGPRLIPLNSLMLGSGTEMGPPAGVVLDAVPQSCRTTGQGVVVSGDSAVFQLPGGYPLGVVSAVGDIGVQFQIEFGKGGCSALYRLEQGRFLSALHGANATAAAAMEMT